MQEIAANPEAVAAKVFAHQQTTIMNTGIPSAMQLKIALTTEEREQAIQLLQQHQLPVADIDDDKLLYLLLDGETVIGTAGLEIFEDCALLRSVSVNQEQQGKGYGKFLNETLEQYAKESGINCMYLLTTTAKDFFDRQGYCVITREEAPTAIKATAEFSSLCPSSAVVMKKRL
ncbi:MAG: GNAT family N-acetyltransferase [Bacteroidetes bacterium]|nr:GNAT family N-acetyltransferase [Bacteroidota bacterium]